jgi:single-strand DNA-binding protein
MLNKATLIGNLGQDPELNYTGSGTAVCKFSLATSEKYKDNAGEWQERTEWHNIVVWGKQAETVAKFLQKGRQAYIEGRLQTSSWDDKETGQKRYKTEIHAGRVLFLGSDKTHTPTQRNQQPFQEQQQENSPGQPANQDRMPF